MIELRWLQTRFPDGNREQRLQFRSRGTVTDKWTEWQDVPIEIVWSD